jgi:hypothetical protein
MAEVTPKSGVLIMANADTFTPNGRKIRIKGVRLIAGSTAATATITDSSSKIIYSMAAIIGAADESTICTNIDSVSIVAALVGTGATLYVYLD